jgi:hypothetical protein
VFDRSWYGRVLVERVEGFCTEADWMRAYGEINEFEASLRRHGVVLAKFWLAIGKDEQYRRFKAREEVEFKRFKITDEDWRNREKWDDYEAAVCDMVDRSSTARGAVDAGRGQQQVPRPHQGAAHLVRGGGGCARGHRRRQAEEAGLLKGSRWQEGRPPPPPMANAGSAECRPAPSQRRVPG